jgi:hypothetical protein
MQSWTPRFHTSMKGDALLLVWCDLHGVNVRLNAFNPAPGLAVWLATWLAAYLAQKPGYQLDDEAVYFYVLVGDIQSCSPDLGLIDGRSVLEVGVGGLEAGPEGGVETVAALLVNASISMLAPVAAAR